VKKALGGKTGLTVSQVHDAVRKCAPSKKTASA